MTTGHGSFKIRPNGSGRTNIDASCTNPCLTDGFEQWGPDGEWIASSVVLGPQLARTTSCPGGSLGPHLRPLVRLITEASVDTAGSIAPSWMRPYPITRPGASRPSKLNLDKGSTWMPSRAAS